MFLVTTWQGEPVETEEMKPAWFSLSGIPFDRMWGDYTYWLAQAVRGQQVAGTFVYAADNKTIVRVNGLLS